MAKIVKTLNLLNQDYEFDAAKLEGKTSNAFIQKNGDEVFGVLVFDGDNTLEARGSMTIDASDALDIDAGTSATISVGNTTLKVQNGGVYINNQQVVPGGGYSSGGLSYVGTGVCYDSSLFNFEDLDFNTNQLNGHHVLIDWYLEDKGSHLGTSTTYFSSGAYGRASVYFATSVQMMGVCVFSGIMMTGPGPYFDGGFMVIDNEDLVSQIEGFGLRGEFYIMD